MLFEKNEYNPFKWEDIKVKVKKYNKFKVLEKFFVLQTPGRISALVLLIAWKLLFLEKFYNSMQTSVENVYNIVKIGIVKWVWSPITIKFSYLNLIPLVNKLRSQIFILKNWKFNDVNSVRAKNCEINLISIEKRQVQ